MNPVYASDIFKNDGAIKSFAEDLEVLRKEQALNAKQAKILEDAVRSLTGATEAEQDAIQEQVREARRINSAYKRYKDSISETSIAVEKLRAETNEVNKINRLTVKLNNSAKGSYDRLSAQYSLIKIRLNKMGDATAEARKEKEKMERVAKSLRDRMKELQKQTGDNTLNVGNYQDALENLQGPIGDTIGGVKSLGAQFKALLKNPVALVLTAIVGALVALGRAFFRSEKGALLLAKASGFLQGVLSSLVKIASDLADKLTGAFENPKEAAGGFLEFISGQFTNRISALGTMALNMGKAFALMFKKDGAEEMTAALEELGKASQRLVTGLDPEQQEKLNQAFSDGVVSVNETVNAFTRLEVKKREVARLNTLLTRQAEQLRTQEELYQQAADDTTLSLTQQAEALERALAVGEKRIQKEIVIARESLGLLRQELSLRKSNGEDVLALLEQETGAIVAVEQAERELALFRANAASQRRLITRDAYERELDFAIDLFDAEKTRLERIASNSENSLSIRAAALGKIIELDRSAFAEQIRLTEEFTGQRVKLNELALIDDERIVRERLAQLQIDDIVMGRILEILRERKMMTQDIADLEVELTKIRKEEGATSVRVLSGANKELERQIELRNQLAVTTAKRLTTTPDAAGPQSIYDLLGITIGDAEKQALADATSFAIEQVQALAQAKVDAANQAVAAADREVEAANRKLDNDIRQAELGLAVNITRSRLELAIAEERQRQSLEQQRKAQKEQEFLQSLSQVSSLVTASARILAEVPFPASLAAVGLMFGSFAFAKIRARRATREYGEGDFSMLSGPSHSSKSKGIPLGIGPDGVAEYAEGGEARAIFSKKAVGKYGGRRLRNLVDGINNLRFEELFNNSFATIAAVPTQTLAVDTSKMENELSAIRANGESSWHSTPDGRRVRTYKNQIEYYD